MEGDVRRGLRLRLLCAAQAQGQGERGVPHGRAGAAVAAAGLRDEGTGRGQRGGLLRPAARRAG
eukprot:1046055-Alexandrium_andersonii.AAC.1